MSKIKFGLPALAIIFLFGCKSPVDSGQILEDLQENFDFGNNSAVIQLADSLKKIKNINQETLHIADSLAEIAERINLDFSVNESQENELLEKLAGRIPADQRSAYEKKNWLEYRVINGEKRYFGRAASNLLLLRKFYEQKGQVAKPSPEDSLRLIHTAKVLRSSSENPGKPCLPVRMEVTYTISVHPDVVPDGEIVRCWLPFPRNSLQRQGGINLISTSNPQYLVAPDSSIHSSLYMEEHAKKGNPTVFQIKYSYTSNAQYFKMSDIKIGPYDKSSHDYLKYTTEQLPHICFTDEVRHIADSLTRDETDPAEIVKRIYFWFKENIPWTGALEYSIMPNIPEYVLKNRRGDCGMQTFLFISMLRYKGIPARWQSGWMMPPDNENLHDWSEVYFEGTGWVPVDVTYDLQKSNNEALRDYFLSGLDSYRLIVNSGVAGPLHPEKHFLRSEPYDFQRGEVEWKEGNLYFDKWDYNMKITYPE